MRVSQFLLVYDVTLTSNFSIGTCGETPPVLCWPAIFICLCHCPYFFESRVSLRGTEEPDLFNFVIAGKNINQAQIANDQSLLREVIVKNTTRKDLKLGECPWISYYTFVFVPLLSFEDLHRFPGPTSEW